MKYKVNDCVRVRPYFNEDYDGIIIAQHEDYYVVLNIETGEAQSYIDDLEIIKDYKYNDPLLTAIFKTAFQSVRNAKRLFYESIRGKIEWNA